MRHVHVEWRRPLAVVGVVALAIGAVTRAPATTPPSDARITTAAKISLLTAESVSATAVDVDTTEGEVTLHGSVGSAAQRSQAETLVRTIDGVRAVRNLLQVVPPGQRAAVGAADSDIRTRLKEALKTDPQLEHEAIDIRAVNDGVVLLGGEVTTLSSHLRALDVATRVPGVRRVATEIRSPDRLADEEIRRDTAREGGASTRGLVRDLWVTSAVKMMLLADARTPGLSVSVDTRDGRVTLFGTVPSAEAKAAAEEDARAIAGVRSVENALEIVPPAETEAVDANDAEVERRVVETLSGNDGLAGTRISVAVRNGVARLSGTVPSEVQRLRAAVSARGVSGVRAVRDDLQIEVN
jgi:hyperosmotically inducible protein